MQELMPNIHRICETKHCQGKEQRTGLNWNERYWLNCFEPVNGRTLPQLLKYFLTMVSETAFGMPPTYILGPAPWGTADLGPLSDAPLPLLSVPAADPASMHGELLQYTQMVYGKLKHSLSCICCHMSVST